jgi:hypothetical protein
MIHMFYVSSIPRPTVTFLQSKKLLHRTGHSLGRKDAIIGRDFGSPTGPIYGILLLERAQNSHRSDGLIFTVV